jgi:glycosyltransferase involved in cell wall biosynthesis
MNRPAVWWVNQFAKTPDLPGGTRHYEMSARLAARGWSVTLVASDLNLTTRRYMRRKDASDRRPIEEQGAGFRIVWLPAGSYERNDWRRAISMLSFSWHAFRTLLRSTQRGDVVIGSSPHLLAALASWAGARIRRARFVLEVRDLWPESLVAVQGSETLLSRVLRPVATLLYRRSDSIVVLAKGSEDHLKRLGIPGSKIHWIPNGFAPGADPALNRSALPDSLEWIADENVFIYAGAHGPANGLEILIDVAEILTERRVPARILLLGDGPSKVELQSDVEQRGVDALVFHPPVVKSLVPSLLHHCVGGLMILKDAPLFAYGVSPNKLFDYLGAGLPVVANVPGDVAQILAECDGGVSVSPNDAAAIADAIERILGDPGRRLGAQQWVRENYSRDRLAERLERVIADIS